MISQKCVCTEKYTTLKEACKCTVSYIMPGLHDIFPTEVLQIVLYTMYADTDMLSVSCNQSHAIDEMTYQ